MEKSNEKGTLMIERDIIINIGEFIKQPSFIKGI